MFEFASLHPLNTTQKQAHSNFTHPANFTAALYLTQLLCHEKEPGHEAIFSVCRSH